MSTTVTTRDIILALGGSAKVAQALGLANPASVWNWTRADRGIPGAYWPAIVDLCWECGRYDINHEILLALNPPRSARRIDD